MTQEFEINLDNKEEARKQVKLVQKSINELLEVCNDQKKQLKENIKTISEAEKHIKNLTDTSIGLSDSLKAVHLILGSKKDLFKGDKEIEAIMNTLSTFVLGSGAIKLGVLSNAKDKENEAK